MKNPEIDTYKNKIWRNKLGQFHRIDGPAYERADGSKQWYINGERHRIDGPAIEDANGNKAWYINGKKIDKEEVKSWYTELNLDPNILLTTDQQILFKLKFG